MHFFSMDVELRQASASCGWTPQGSTAVVVLVNSTHIVSANVGDAQAMLLDLNVLAPASSETIASLTRDHKPKDPSEQGRIKSTPGYYVVADRVMHTSWDVPNINVSRALGDFHCKPLPDSPESNPVSPEPHIKILPLEKAKAREFVLLVASDGVLNEDFDGHRARAALLSWRRAQWMSEFLGRPPNWHACAKEILSVSESSNHGDNQGLHVVHMTQLIDSCQGVSLTGCANSGAVKFSQAAGHEEFSQHGRWSSCLEFLSMLL